VDSSVADSPVSESSAAGPDFQASESKPLFDDSESGRYEIEEINERRCPACKRLVTPDAAVCVACGLDLKTNKKIRTVYQPVWRTWESGISFGKRMALFLAIEAIILPMAIVGGIVERSIIPFFPWLLFSILLAFVLGTYERVDLYRNERGRITILKTWRICFLARPVEQIKPFRYTGIRTVGEYGIAFMDWMMVAFIGGCGLLPSVLLGVSVVYGDDVNLAILIPLGVVGLIPGVIFWLYLVRRVTYHVHLTGEQGHSEVRLFTGQNEAKMQEITSTLHSLTGLPCGSG
jgi:hypothetical protein